jgi:hypothetical protein
MQEWEIHTVVYRINSTLNQSVTVVIEQPALPQHELYETPAPSEQAQGMARWAVPCGTNVETIFTVRYRRMLSRRESVQSFSMRQLQEFLRQRFLDDATYKGLEGVLAIYNDIQQHQERLRQLAQERDQIYKRQQQTQGSLGPLGRDGEEGKLRARYVAQLNELENRLNAITAEESRINTEIQKLDQQASTRLAALSR